MNSCVFLFFSIAEGLMKHIFIINPTAGKSDSRQRIYDMADALRTRHDLDVQCILT